MLHTLNTLYLTTQGAYVYLDHDTVKVKVEDETQLQVPLLHLGAIVCFGHVTVSAPLMQRCGMDGRAVIFHNYRGRFQARVTGPTGGNVLLRRAQHEALSNSAQTIQIAKACVAGKMQNSRQVLLRAGREAANTEDTAALGAAAQRIAFSLHRLRDCTTLDAVRGNEGDAARAYFQVFGRMVRSDREAFPFSGRVRRPPIGRTNALLSFLYAMLLNDCVSALDSVGLDPQVGYLHALRPGKPALALDLMEELRAFVADRLVLSLINRRQIGGSDFDDLPGGAARLTDKGRREVIVAYQRRKQDEVQHPVLDRKVQLGLVPHLQARLLARYLRGDLGNYPPFLTR